MNTGLAGLQSQLGTFGSDPLVVERAEGVYLYDPAGRRYLDVMSGYWLACLGYGDPILSNVLAQSSRRLSFWHQYGTAHVDALEYAERIFSLLPERLLGKILFANTGSGAMEIALRVACASVNRRGKIPRIAHLDRSYHGSTFLAQQLSPSLWNDWPSNLRLEPKYITQVNAPICPSSSLDVIQYIQINRPSIVVTEPVQGVGGMFVPPDEFFVELRKVCDELGIIWISDEISTGFGATGRLFAFEHNGVHPDILVLGKKMAAGYFPMSAAVVGRAVSEEVLREDFHYGHSTSGHPIGCAIARSVLDRVAAPTLLANVCERSVQLVAGLTDLRSTYTWVGPVRGRGLMISLEVPNSAIAESIARGMRETGIYELPEGRFLTFCPPYIIDEGQIDKVLESLRGIFECIQQ